MTTSRKRVVIVGAGFGGLWAAKALAAEDVEVLLLDRNNFHTFYPLLYQIGAAELEASEIAQPVRSIFRKRGGVRFRMAEVTGLDLAARRVLVDGEGIPYDRLILAPGSAPHYLGIPGAEEHSFPLRDLEHGLALRNHVLSRFEAAARLPAGRRPTELRFVVVGGGPTGVEFAGALAELIRGPLAKDFPELRGAMLDGDHEGASVLLIEATGRLLGTMPEELGRYAERRLESMGVDVRLDAPVREVRPDGVALEDGTTIPSATVVWTAGFRGTPDAVAWGLPARRNGRVPVRPTLQLEERDDVYVVGDLAHIESEPEGAPLPMLAPVAMQQGERAARNILRELEGRPPRPFRYEDPGMLATIGRNKAVARIRGRDFTGFPAWFLWVVIHIAKLIGFRNRLVVLINWAWDYFFYERAVRLVLPLRRAGELEAARDPRRLAAASLGHEAGGREDRSPGGPDRGRRKEAAQAAER